MFIEKGLYDYYKDKRFLKLKKATEILNNPSTYQNYLKIRGCLILYQKKLKIVSL